MESARFTAREALERLPAQLGVARGGIRIIVCFRLGRLHGPIRVSTFRVPPSAILSVQFGPLDEALLEQIARELGLGELVEAELTIEYQSHGDHLKLHWLDIEWQVAR